MHDNKIGIDGSMWHKGIHDLAKSNVDNVRLIKWLRNESILLIQYFASLIPVREHKLCYKISRLLPDCN